MIELEDPFEILAVWYAEAREHPVPQADAAALSTATAAGVPSSRMVLWRGVYDGALCFYTNRDSRKVGELKQNPHAALLFFWVELGRQVRVEGRVDVLPDATADRYFASRPRGSQLAAWASPQSQELDRDALLERYRKLEAEYEGVEVPRPPFWGGYGLLPQCFEFWQEREHRLHERLRLERGDGGWARRWLAP